MSYAIADLLTYQNLGQAYTTLASLSVRNPMLDYYNKPQNGEHQVEIVKYNDTRQAAPINSKGSPARTLDTQGGTSIVFTPVHVFNEIHLTQDALDFLRMEDSPQLQDRGMQEIRRQMEIFSRKHRALRAVTLAKALAGGIIYFDSNGQVLETSSGAAVTIDLGVSSTHKSQLNHASAGADIIGTAWDNPAASILTDLEQIREAAEYDQVATPRHVWLHSVAKPWILGNTEIKAFVQYNNPQAMQYLNTFAAASDTLNIGDWTFHFYNGTYVGADGTTVRPLIPKTGAIITPDVNDTEWFAHYECAETIPKNEGVIGSWDEFFSNTQKVYGDFAYAKVIDNPLKVALRMGMNFFYGFRDPNAVFYATVDF